MNSLTLSSIRRFFHKQNRIYVLTLALVITVLMPACSKLDDPSLEPAFDATLVEQPAPMVAQAYSTNKNVFFGDLHIHTELSTDAYVMGVRSVPDDVYRFAKGATIEHGAGYPIKISRPLDFAAVTDHSEYLGQARQASLDVPTTRKPLRDLLLNGSVAKITKAWLETTGFIRKNGFGFGVDIVDREINQGAWQLIIDAAERHNEPGVFTAFIGYEWSAFAESSSVHLHRNIIYRSNQVAPVPFSSIDSDRPEDLWKFLQLENQQGRACFAIPHNANLSNGNMYASRDSEGQPLTAEYAAMRSRFEPISEILQIKGASETHTLLSTEDEFADFELTDLIVGGGDPSLEQVKGSYMRDALRVGMELSHSEGFNPFKFGVIGSSDSHNASSPSDEANYTGKLPMMDGSAGLRTGEALLLPSSVNPVTRWGSGGLAGVWAHENTRAALFDALLAKETFATSGPRISVRFFAGLDYTTEMLQLGDTIAEAYARGVPMGGQLRNLPENRGPRFLVLAMKDPDGANLDRAQIIKAWVDSDGVSHEKIFDVAVSDGRTFDTDLGKVPGVGNTVDLATATYTNEIGATSLSVVWTDPEFDANQEAFYYVRVLEIPTPRWSTYDAVMLDIEPMEPATIQERAITSAIWYSSN